MRKINKRSSLIFISLVGLVLTGLLLAKFLDNETEEFVTGEKVAGIDPIIFDDLAGKEGSFILDVHIPEQEHIPGTDAFIPYNQIEDNLDKLPEDKQTLILVYCRSGSMSKEAAQTLVNLGYEKVYDLVGGINAYREAHVSVELSPKLKDLGKVIYGDVAVTEFVLTNFAPAPLMITRVATSCGCTRAEVEKRELAAYESTLVRVSFDPAVHKDDTDLGEVTRTIYIETDNPNFSKITAEINASVVKKAD